MATYWASKAAADTVTREWTPLNGLSVSSATFTVSSGGVTISSTEYLGDVVSVTVTGGTNGTPAVIAASATMGDGQVITDTIYLPIYASTQKLANTVRDVCNFALRIVTGIAEVADADQLSDAQERFDDLVATHFQGLGISLPSSASDALKVPDYAVNALKQNLILALAPMYGFTPAPITIRLASSGLSQVKMGLLPVRDVEYF